MMKRVFTAIALGLLVYICITLLCVLVDTVGVLLYGWENDGYGYIVGANALGPLVAIYLGVSVYRSSGIRGGFCPCCGR